ncbi:sulfotransferase domain-containing protein [Aliiruegeria sabulilitoris]|uniref:sulfotransferase domain-containing protein n=1 Tax=Aliiruegeria sabulilitoris TaxID=1510458 RepID=UPI0009EA8E11|nr:sulfotransferase domain-containing protein [Aliiruegeria sabulilitoris]NDR56624.1 hypothetical protein [Pseudoruegeria sp. M32A2M]
MKVDLVITGMHRSGTTWMGRAIDALPIYGVVHEPFNVDHGVRDVPNWYLDHRRDKDTKFALKVVSEIENGTANFRWTPKWKNPVRSFGTLVLGTRAARHFRQVVRSGVEKLAIKDPFLLMMVPEIQRQGVKTIVSVRHPGAILLSLRRLSWPIPTEHLWGRDPAGAIRAREHGDIAAICAFWNGVYLPVLDLLRKGSGESIFIANHEEMFNDIEELEETLRRFLEIGTAFPEFSSFLRNSTSGETVNPSHKKLHDFSRNSSELAKSWKKSFSTEEIRYFDDNVGEAFETLNSWKNG